MLTARLATMLLLKGELPASHVACVTVGRAAAVRLLRRCVFPTISDLCRFPCFEAQLNPSVELQLFKIRVPTGLLLPFTLGEGDGRKREERERKERERGRREKERGERERKEREGDGRKRGERDRGRRERGREIGKWEKERRERGRERAGEREFQGCSLGQLYPSWAHLISTLVVMAEHLQLKCALKLTCSDLPI